MKRNRILTIQLVALLAIGMLALTACKTSGMAVTSRGQVLNLSIEHPERLPDQGQGDLEVHLTSAGVNNVSDVLLEVELPPQLVVMDTDFGEGVNVVHTPGSSTWLFTYGQLQPTERTSVKFRVQTAFGSMRETGEVRATAWQRSLPGDKLVETALIRLQQ